MSLLDHLLLETKVLSVGQTAMGLNDPPVPVEKTTIERVLVNPKLDEARFSEAGPNRRCGV